MPCSQPRAPPPGVAWPGVESASAAGSGCASAGDLLPLQPEAVLQGSGLQAELSQGHSGAARPPSLWGPPSHPLAASLLTSLYLVPSSASQIH